MNSTLVEIVALAERRPTPRTMPLTTLATGECVMIDLRGRMDRSDIYRWHGRVVAVDSVAVRIAVDWYQPAFTRDHLTATGERIIPWSRIESLSIVAEQGR